MPKHHSARLATDHLGRFHEGHLAERQYDAACHARIDHPAIEGENDDHGGRGGADGRENDEREQKPGKGDLGIDDAHDHAVGASAEVARNQPHHHAEGAGQRHHRHPDAERGARSIDQSAQHIATEIIGT